MTGSTLAARIFTLVISAVTGAAVGFVLTFTHRQYVLEVVGVPVPLGLIGGFAIVAALLLGMRLSFAERLAPLAAGLGIVLASAALVLPTASGSVLSFGDGLDYAWAVGPTIIAIVVLGWPERRRPAEPTPRPSVRTVDPA